MGLTYDEYLEGTIEILKESQKEGRKYELELLGKKFIVFPNVFSPKYFYDSRFFIENLPFRKEESLLEIGPGSGVISVFAALRGSSKVVAIDINPDAVENTRENARINGVSDVVQVFQGDVYGPLKEEKFNIIFWNTPFGYVEDEDITDLEKSVQDPGYKSTKKFVFGAKKHLLEGGKLLIGFSTTLGKFEIIEDFLKEAGFEVKLLSEIASKEKYPVKFEIFECTPV